MRPLAFEIPMRRVRPWVPLAPGMIVSRETTKGGTIYGSDGRDRKFLETTEHAPEVDEELVDLGPGH